MKAAVLYGKHDLRIEDLPVPAKRDGYRLVKVAYCGICGTDVHLYEGDEGSVKLTPGTVPGHELSGTLVDSGEAVTLDPNYFCGKCDSCLSGNPHYCENIFNTGVTVNGGFAEYVVARADKIYKIPDAVSMRDAALAELYSLGVHSARKARVEPGDRVVILGAGRLGLSVLEVVRQTAAAWVAAVDVVDNRLEIAVRMGADLTINARVDDPVDAILSQTGGLGVDRVIECVGTYVEIPDREGPVQQAVKMARNGGRVVVMGLGSQLTPVFWKACVFKELEIVGSRVTFGDYPRALRLMELNRFHPELLISEVFDLNQIDRAFDLLEEKPDRYLKVLVKHR